MAIGAREQAVSDVTTQASHHTCEADTPINQVGCEKHHG